MTWDVAQDTEAGRRQIRAEMEFLRTAPADGNIVKMVEAKAYSILLRKEPRTLRGLQRGSSHPNPAQVVR